MIAGLFLYACARARRPLPAPRPAGRRGAARRRHATRCSPPSRSTRGTATGTCAPSTPPATRSARAPATRAGSSSRARPGASRRRRAGERPRATRARERARASLHRRTASSSTSPPTRRYRPGARRDHELPAGLQGERGLFCHNNTWIKLAWCLLGEGDRALDYYLAICPSAKEERIETYRSEPYVYAQMIAGPDAATPGEAKNSWLTGTAAWTFVALAQGILGIQPDYDGPAHRPVHPRDWPVVPRHAALPRRRLRDLGREPRRRLPRRPLAARRRARGVDGNLVPPRPRGERVRVDVVLGCPDGQLQPAELDVAEAG